MTSGEGGGSSLFRRINDDLWGRGGGIVLTICRGLRTAQVFYLLLRPVAMLSSGVGSSHIGRALEGTSQNEGCSGARQ